MRFKAKLAADQVSLLLQVISPISKLQDSQKGAVLYLDPDFIRISSKGVSGIACFAELSKHIFLEHRIESAADNVIVCQVDLVSFKVALQSVVSTGNAWRKRKRTSAGGNGNHNSNTPMITSLYASQAVTLKLAKRNRMPCLCLDGHATDEGSVEIHQAIPIRILRANEMQYYLPPQISTPTVQLELPSDRPLRTVVDKLKSMAPHVYVEASGEGDLTIRLDHAEGCTMAVYYNDLVSRSDEQGSQQPLSPSQPCILKVDGTKLSQCLQWQQSHLGTLTCLVGLIPNEMLVLHIVLRPEELGFFTYYLPVYYMDDEEVQAMASDP
eukprot:Nitzschia sp. Nitz4//scaffold42_size132992//76878//77942//NITZ4_003402-RA/size132992-augustus-gene-0.106-mRNA-1//1//CDS//3329551727//6531//frame0